MIVMVNSRFFTNPVFTNTVDDFKVLEVEYTMTEVNMMVSEMLAEYMSATNPMKFDKQFKSIEDCVHQLNRYRKTLLSYRVQQISKHGHLENRTTLNELNVLPYDFLIINNIGEYKVREMGLCIRPRENCIQFEDLKDEEGKVYNEKMGLNDLLAFSRKLSFWDREGISLTKGAFPRGVEGSEAMNFILVDNIIRGRVTSDDVDLAYISAFLGTKLVQESEANLFMVKYTNTNLVMNDVQAANDTLFKQTPQGRGDNNANIHRKPDAGSSSKVEPKSDEAIQQISGK